MNKKQKEEYFEYLKNRKYDKYFPFECIARRISILVMFSSIINNHPEELEESYRNIIIKRGANPSEPLGDFIILDIRNFYHLAYRMFKDTIDYPSTHEYVKKLRDNSVGHFLNDKPEEVVELYKKYDSVGGFKKIFSDYLDFKEFIKKKLKK